MTDLCLQAVGKSYQGKLCCSHTPVAGHLQRVNYQWKHTRMAHISAVLKKWSGSTKEPHDIRLDSLALLGFVIMEQLVWRLSCHAGSTMYESKSGLVWGSSKQH